MKRAVVDTVVGPYGPVELVRITSDDGWNLRCYRCESPLDEGDAAQDRGDRWYCRNCAR